jgi:hypothetical protein
MALTIGLAIGVSVGALALRPAAATSQAAAPYLTHPGNIAPRGGHAAAATSAQRALTNYTQIVADLKAAESQRDFAAKYRFERQLPAALTASTIGLIYQEHTRLMESLAEAKAAGNGYATWRLGQDLDALCGPAAVKDLLTFC